MQTLNQIQIMGNIGVKAKMLEFPNGGKKTVLSVATNIGYGENQKTQWHTVLLYNKSAEICSGLDKGDVIWVSGYMDYRKWTDDNDVVRISAEIHADKFLIIEGTPVKPSESAENEIKGGSYANAKKSEPKKPENEKPVDQKAPPKKLDPEDSTPKDLPY